MKTVEQILAALANDIADLERKMAKTTDTRTMWRLEAFSDLRDWINGPDDED